MNSETPLKPFLRPKVYRARQGAKVTLVLLEPPDSGRVLIRFEAFEGGEWNGRVILHEKKGSGDREQFLTDQLDRPSVVLKWGTLETQPPGCDREYFMHYDARDSESVDAQAIIEEYERQRQAVSAPPRE